MPIIDIQKRARELGRIRMGQVVATPSGKTRPAKLERFRLTSPSKPLLDKVAALYGGEVKEWTPQGGGPKAWEVLITDQRIPIMVPPQPITQWLETWTGGGCVHRCDGYTNVLTDEPCDPEDPNHINAKHTTRLNVVLRDIEGIGVWRLETHGKTAAMELPAVADFLAQAGGYVEAWLALEEKKMLVDGETFRFMVPKIDVEVTPAQLLAGKGGISAPAIEGPVERPAIEAGTSDPYTPYFEKIAAAATPAECTDVFNEALAADLIGPRSPATARREQLFEAIGSKGKALLAASDTVAPEDEGSPSDAVSVNPTDPEPDADVVWQQILALTGAIPWSLSDLKMDYANTNGGVDPDSASGAELAAYLQALTVRVEQGEQVPA